MDNSPNSHDLSSEKPINNESISDTSTITIEQLTQVTSPELTEVASILIETLKTGRENKNRLQELWVEYTNRVETQVDSIRDKKARTQAQIAAIINKAFIFQRSGNTTRYLEELDEAEVYASNEGFNTISTSLKIEIKSAVESLELSPEIVVLKLKGIIADANREYLKESIRDGADLEDIIGNAYGMILEEGEDPNEVLAMIGITEQ